MYSDFDIVNGVLKGYSGRGEVVDIPDGVTYIGEKVFWNCCDIKRVIIPNTVKIIGLRAFKGCNAKIEESSKH